jgi:hypothetical protein
MLFRKLKVAWCLVTADSKRTSKEHCLESFDWSKIPESTADMSVFHLYLRQGKLLLLKR